MLSSAGSLIFVVVAMILMMIIGLVTTFGGAIWLWVLAIVLLLAIVPTLDVTAAAVTIDSFQVTSLVPSKIYMGRPRRIMTFNTHGVPTLLNFIGDGIRTSRKLEKWIITELDSSNIDVVVLQEMFVPRWTEPIRKAFNRIGWSVVFPPVAKAGDLRVSSGVWIASRLNIDSSTDREFTRGIGPDIISRKGFIVVRIADTQVIGLHLQDSEHDSDRTVRQSQLDEIQDFLSNETCECTIITGDFNIQARDMPGFRFNGKIISARPTDIDYAVVMGPLHGRAVVPKILKHISDHEPVFIDLVYEE